MASFTFTPHQMVRTPSMSVPHPQQLLQAADAPQELGPADPVQSVAPVQPPVEPARTEFANPHHAQSAVMANAQPAPEILRRNDLPEVYDPLAQPVPPQAGYIDEFFDLSALPDAAPSTHAAQAYDKSRGLFGAPNQKFGRY